MPGLEDFAMPVILAIALVVLAAFGLGTRANVRAGERAMKWLREGLPVLGEKTTMNWIGSAAVVLKIAKAKGAYRNTEIVFSFEPRDVVFLWLFARWQGRRDLMIFRGTLNARRVSSWRCSIRKVGRPVASKAKRKRKTGSGWICLVSPDYAHTILAPQTSLSPNRSVPWQRARAVTGPSLDSPQCAQRRSAVALAGSANRFCARSVHGLREIGDQIVRG